MDYLNMRDWNANANWALVQEMARQYRLYPEWLSSRLLQSYLVNIVPIHGNWSGTYYFERILYSPHLIPVNSMFYFLRSFREILAPSDFDVLVAYCRARIFEYKAPQPRAAFDRAIAELYTGDGVVFPDEVNTVSLGYGL